MQLRMIFIQAWTYKIIIFVGLAMTTRQKLHKIITWMHFDLGVHGKVALRDGFADLKDTALGNPKLLDRMTCAPNKLRICFPVWIQTEMVLCLDKNLKMYIATT